MILTNNALLDCSSSVFGCCPDQLTPASGWNLLGCPGTVAAVARMLFIFSTLLRASLCNHAVAHPLTLLINSGTLLLSACLYFPAMMTLK